jgi:hypothetical protein
LISFLAHFGPPTLVWLVGAYHLYRATQVEGSVSERNFAIGLLLVILAPIIGSARRSRQTTTRERALENQLHQLNQRFRGLERRVDGLILELETENAAQALGEAVKRHSGQKPPWMRLVSSQENLGKR